MPEKSRGMADKRVNDLTKIDSAPGNGVLPIDVPGSEETNGITVENLFNNIVNDKSMGVVDANTINTNGIYRCGSTSANVPFSYGLLLVFYSLGYAVQIGFSVLDNKMYMRYSSESGLIWSDWKSITFT